MISILDYGAGNVRSVRNALRKLGYDFKNVCRPEDIMQAERLIFPGVGSFGNAISRLLRDGYLEPLQQYLKAGRPFLGICLGLQTLFEGSDESPGVAGLGIIPGYIRRFDDTLLSVPHIGWNGINMRKESTLFSGYGDENLYFIHSYRAFQSESNKEWILATTNYGEEFVSGVQKGNVTAFQFHPEKSGEAGLRLLANFLAKESLEATSSQRNMSVPVSETTLAKRVIACLDVRANDEGDLVVTKGDQYDVREAGSVRNLGKPVELAKRYYDEGADEITFLNITGFRDFPLEDQPMLEVLRLTSENVFVPLTIGGGIREYTDADGRYYSALDVASEYFRSGADKISIGSDAVYTVEEYLRGVKTNQSSIEQIAKVYGNQAVVISIDPRRVYVRSPEDTSRPTIATATLGPNGEEYCWFQCTVKGGREGRDVDAVELARSCETFGAGEILLNSIDRDGTGIGFDIELIAAVSDAVSIPVIASSGAGGVEHFSEIFENTDAEAALAAGIFHRKEVPITAVKKHLRMRGIAVR